MTNSTRNALIRKAGGFTLVELLVVLAIIGMLITAMPAVVASVQSGVRLKAAARSLADELRASRATAILNHRETRLTLDLATGQYLTTPGGVIRGLPAGVVLKFEGPRTEINGGNADIRFFADGTSTGGRIGLAVGNSQHWVVTHWLSGRISADE
jgi:general secretion pathway protein H